MRQTTEILAQYASYCFLFARSNTVSSRTIQHQEYAGDIRMQDFSTTHPNTGRRKPYTHVEGIQTTSSSHSNKNHMLP